MLRFHEPDRSDVWYYKIGSHLAKAFEIEVERGIRLIAEAPHRWPIYQEKFRRILLRRFPYFLIYHAREQVVTIIAVAHARRKPGYWRNR